MKKDFVFITDLHIGAGTNVRTGDVYSDLLSKLKFVRDYCNKFNCTLLIGGDVFDKPTIADVYKIPFIELFKSFNEIPYVIFGNHDRLFSSDENNFKTSLELFVKSGVFKLLDYVDFGDYIMTSRKPLKTCGKPQIFMYHGFLNKEDGRNSVFITDLNVTDQVLCLLGHDHVVYDPITFGTVRVIRPGSLLRGIRNDDNMRIPKLVHIKMDTEASKVFRIKFVEIPCRDANEIFKSKEATLGSKDVARSYESIINSIKNASKNELGFLEAFKTVSDSDVYGFVENILLELNNKKLSK